MGVWNSRQAIEAIGTERFDAWQQARRGSRFSRCLIPRVCERCAENPEDQEARDVMARYTAELIKARLTK